MSGSAPAESSGDKSLRKALQPLVEESIRISIQRDPGVLAEALFPVIGAAVRKAVAAALASLVQSLNQTLDNSLSVRSLQWRVEALRTGRPFGEIVLARSLQYRVEQAFLIHRKTGILLRHEAAIGLPVQDADMISGMLRAIEDFVQDSFGEGESEGLDTIQVGELNVWVQHGPTALLACVVRGIAPRQLERVFQNALERIHMANAAALHDFSGQTDAFSDCSADLKSCLLGQLDEGRKSSFAGVIGMAVIAMILLLAFAGWRWNVHANWNDYLESLRRTKGLVVVSSDVGWRSFRISGLRDPAAPDPQAGLPQFGIEPARVDAHWEPYLSLDPKMVARRRLAELIDSVPRYHVRFAIGKAELNPLMLDPIIADVRVLLELANQAAQPLRITVQGRSDASGPETLNKNLARDRGRAVLKEFIARGLPETSFTLDTKLSIAADVILQVEEAK